MLVFVKFSEPLNQVCEARSCSFSPGTNTLAGGASRRAQPHDLVITKDMDKTSQALFRYSTSGTLFRSVVIELRRNAKSDAHLTYECSDVLISSFVPSGPLETVSLSFTGLKASYAH